LRRRKKGAESSSSASKEAISNCIVDDGCEFAVSSLEYYILLHLSPSSMAKEFVHLRLAAPEL
jgi:hypothetical protein